MWRKLTSLILDRFEIKMPVNCPCEKLYRYSDAGSERYDKREVKKKRFVFHQYADIIAHVE